MINYGTNRRGRRKAYRKLRTSLPSGSRSVLLDRGLANCPAIRPMRTTGMRPPQIRIREKDKISPILLDMFSCTGVNRLLELLKSSHECMRRNSLRNLRHEGGRPVLIALMPAVTLDVRSFKGAQWSPWIVQRVKKTDLRWRDEGW
jgi:hypothetical protein